MDSTLHYQSKKDHYSADACIVWCFDDRFSKLFDEFIKKQNYGHVDLVKVAGGAQGLAMSDDRPEYHYLLDQIAKSIKLHHTKEVILMMHSECGAYGGGTDPEFYKAELAKAQAAVAQFSPDIKVTSVFADFEGLHKIE